MKFDKLCGAVEWMAEHGDDVATMPGALNNYGVIGIQSPTLRQWAGGLRGILRRCALFHFPIEPVSREGTEVEYEELSTRLILPFPAVAIEDNHDCSILVDPLSFLSSEAKRAGVEMPPPGGPGLGNKMLMYLRMVSADGLVGISQGLIGRPQAIAKDHAIPIVNRSELGPRDIFGLEGILDFSIFYRKRDRLCDVRAIDASEVKVQSDYMRDGYITLCELLDMHDPRRYWIAKKIDEMASPRSGKIPRSHERVRYVVLESGIVEREFRDPNPENVGTVAPHRRRAHWRYLKAERFKERKFVHVSSCWVGPMTATIGGERYEICPDL